MGAGRMHAGVVRTWVVEGEDDGLLEDRALTHGLGVFETMLAIDGRLPAFGLHYARLLEGCHRLHIRPPEEHALRQAIDELLEDEAPDGRVRVRLTRTSGRGGLRHLPGENALTLVSLSEWRPLSGPLSVILSPWPINEGSPLAGIKCTSYAANLMALDDARQEGADEVIFNNTREELCEAATANVFLVRGGILVTPELDSGCLPGTARRRVIELARRRGITVEERRVDAHELSLSEEILLTSATGGVMAVGELDGMDLAGPGPVTAALDEGFEEMLRVV